jgi:thiamine-phosphate pyrophosphorylase
VVDYRLYVILDPRFCAGRDLVRVAAEAIAGGATILQLRHKDATTRTLLAETEAILAQSRPHGVPLIVNDRVDVALATGADGVHLGPDDLPPPLARRLLGAERLIGVSAGTVAEAAQARAEGADYLGTGDIFGTASKFDAGAPVGPGRLTEVKRAAGLPVVAIGGVSAANAATAIAHGADGVAVITAVVAQPDVRAAARALRTLVDQALAAGQPATSHRPPTSP